MRNQLKKHINEYYNLKRGKGFGFTAESCGDLRVRRLSTGQEYSLYYNNIPYDHAIVA